jgi:co-chaperonin GroES (HSP10)
MQVVGKKVLIELDPKEETTKAGIFLPVANRKQNEGTIVLVGNKAKFGQLGQRVKYYQNCGSPVRHEGKDCLFLQVECEIEYFY